MKRPSMQRAVRALALTFGGMALVAFASHAQMRQSASPTTTSTDMQQTELHELTDVQTQDVDRKQKDAYIAFYKVNEEDPDKKIELGSKFLQKYPKSPLAEAVEVGLSNAFFAKQDWKNFYASADQALAIKPDEVDVLTFVGWVIPHFYDPNDPNAEAQLDKAETYERHALAVMTTMPKPAGVTDAQFAASKAQKAFQAHSGLGLVYFRKQDYDNSAKELQLAVQGNAAPDQADLFVLGVDFQNLKRYGDAAGAFGRCAELIGGLQDRCKQSVDQAKKQASVTSR
jgi:tetratricopeptide (TPR) repeat protein